MRSLGIDIETYSSVDISEAGVYAYVEAPDFEILLIGYKFDADSDVTVIDLTDFDKDSVIETIEMLYPEFWEALTDPDVIKTAYNANFERTALAKYFGKPMPPDQWHCTMVHASMLGLPRSLAGVGEALGLPQDKQKDKIGKSLIDYFCKPCKPTKANRGRTRNLPGHDPEKWKLFIEYNRQDVVAEQAILEKLKPYPIPEREIALWCFDQRMNDAGIRLDMDMVNGIVEHDEKTRATLLQEAKELTGLANPNSLTQLKGWLKDNYYLDVKSLTKDTIVDYINELCERVQDGTAQPEDVNPAIRVLEIRQALGKTSTSKYQAMQRAVCKDNRLRGILQFYGANRTGRWAGRIVQVHNLPQNKIPDIELAREMAANKEFDLLELMFGESAFVFSQLIRTAFIASPGCRFVVADFSAIEARVIAWLANEEWRLEVFRTHGKIYEASASQMFHVPIENIKKGSKLRQQGKVAELALGYGGGFGAIKRMDYSGSIPDDEIPMLISNWRAASPKIVKFWYTCETAAKMAIKEHRTVKIQHNIHFSYINQILFVKLPSGRKLAYYNAKLEPGKKGNEVITYEGVNQETKAWSRQETYGGKLVENIVQAVARDCLAETLLHVDALGYKIVMHVHDEIVVDVPYEDKDALEKIYEIMSKPIDWAPGLPLKGDGYETLFYKKD